ncbi:MAG TPA: citrate synthase, partial [Gemmatimonadaceae bacterium]|nr:citrate synthase [Gemmatimonadaceae bacterium]
MPKTGTTAPPAPTKDSTKTSSSGNSAAPSEGALEVKDSRTNKSYTIPVVDSAIRAVDLKKLKTDDPDDLGLVSYDPAFLNTASCRSAITYIDGDKGILRYRGYPIEQLAENATFLEVAWLLRHGELPNQKEYEQFVHDITFHTYVHENMRKFLEGFRYDAHPMAMLNSSIAALASFYPSARNIFDETERNISIVRLLAKTPTIAAFSYRHVKGLPFVYPDNRLSYVENFLSMVARMTESRYEANPIFARALEILFILHADHEQNCSTNAVRAVGSSHVDPFSAISAGVAALFGPLHGGANEQVLRMIKEIGTVKNVPAFIESVKSGQGGRLMGFGHRVYKSYDPRAKIVKKLADEVFKVVGVDKDLEIALELERIALSDEYFVSRKLYPNVDFYTGLIYRSM